MNLTSARDERRSGIALVIVLGFLALLTILVVAFAITMRTERVAARSYQDSVKAKQLVGVGLARAQAMLDSQLGGVPLKSVYPPSDVMPSINTNPASLFNASSTAPLLDMAVTSTVAFLPTAVLPAALTALPNVGWNDIIINDQNSAPSLIGRVAYLVVNCSGMLDANHAGGLARGPGLLPGEFVISNNVLSELTDAEPNLASNRLGKFKRFESVPDLKVCGLVGNPAPNLSAPPANLFVYSRAPRGMWNASANIVTNPFDLARTTTDVAGVENTFTRAGFLDPVTLRKNLEDYIDADDRPKDASSYCTEAFPMINEIVISNTSAAAGAPVTNTFTFTPTVELVFPFVGYTNTKSYHFKLQMVFSGAVPAGYNPSNRLGNAAYPNSGLYTGSCVFAGPWTPGTNTARPITPLQPATCMGLSPTPANAFANMKATVVLAELRETSAGGALVDEVRGLTNDMSYVSSTIGSTMAGGSACDDPRFNYLGGNPLEWKRVGTGAPTPHTLGGENVGVVTYMNPGCDGTNLMYVRNGPISNTGELGYLLYNSNAFWKTIRLLRNGTNEAHRVLDYFCVNTNAVVRGLVNPNSRQDPALAAALAGARNGFDPVSATSKLSVAAANSIATLIRNNGPFTNKADMGRIDIGDAAWTPTGLAQFQREAVIRHSADVLSPRQNMFTVFLVAQGIRREPGKAIDATLDESTEVISEQRAVAVIWRDPYPVPDPAKPGSYTHEQTVTFFKWLTE